MMIKNLRDWEVYTTDYFPRITILGEIPLTQADFEAVAQEIRSLYKRTGKKLGETTQRLLAQYPHIFVTFLAHFAAYNTRRDFWDALATLLEMTDANFHNWQWHTQFIEILRKNKIKTFLSVGADTNKYVTAMRIHGGIPSYSLPDFFDKMLLPAVTIDRYGGLKGQELLNQLLARSEAQMFMDSPVRNFFENSDSIGLDLLNECVRMAQQYRLTGELPDKLDLPIYISERFVEFMEKRPEKLGLVRLKRPRLIFDPEGEGFLLDLPEQPVSGSQAGAAYWLVAWDQQTKKEYVRLRRLGRDILTEGRRIPFNRAPSQITLSFWLQSEDKPVREQRRWNISLRPAADAAPLLVFRSADGSLLRWNQSLPPEILLLLYPTDIQLKFDGGSELRHQCRPLGGAWQGWRADYRSLEDTGQVRLVRNSKEIAVIPVGRRAEMPTLVGNDPWPLTADPKGSLLYIGAAPRLHIPLHSGIDPENELKRWSITLESVWETKPLIRRNDCQLELHTVSDGLELDLAKLLGPKPLGTYILRASNQRDVEVEYRFRFWPTLIVRDLPNIILPSAEGAPKNIQFTLIIPPDAVCHPQAGVDDVQSKGSMGRYTITVGVDATRADLLLVAPGMDKRPPVQVPLFVPIPRLQWRLLLEEDAAVQWSTRPFERSVDSFLQASNQVLLLRMPGLGKLASSLHLNLVDSTNSQKILQKFTPETDRVNSDYLRFSLPAESTLKAAAESSAFNFELMVLNSAGKYDRLPLLSLTRTLKIYDVKLEHLGDADFELRWREPHPLRNRRVFLRPLWQPWNNGVEFTIPDDARGVFQITEMGLPYSRYEASFYIAPSWKDALTAPPETGDKFYFNTIDAMQYLGLLSEQVKKYPPKAFRCHFESVCIYAHQSAKEQMVLAINQCVDAITSAPLSMVLAFYQWLSRNFPAYQQDVRLKMLSPGLLNKLYLEQRSNDDFRQAYLGDVIQTKTLGPKSALVLLENEDDPLLVLHCLRILLKGHDQEGIKHIIKMIDEGGLSDQDATDLFAAEPTFSLKALADGVPAPIYLRQFTALLQRQKYPKESLTEIFVEHLITLALEEEQTEWCCLYASELLQREEPTGVKRIMALFHDGKLGGHEVTELLGIRPDFSYKTLSIDSENQANRVQMNELARRYPNQTGATPAEILIQSSIVKANSGEYAQCEQFIRQGKKEGVQKALSQVQLGKITSEELYTLFAIDPGLCFSTLLELPRVLQHINTISQVARKFPLETRHVVPGMFIKTPGGWGRIEKIHNGQDTDLDIAQVDEPDIFLGLSLHPELQPEIATLDLGNTKLIFPKSKKLLICTHCKEFITTHKDALDIHARQVHGVLKPAWREHGSAQLPVFRPLEVRDDRAQREKMKLAGVTKRDDLSLLLASLSTNQLFRLAEAGDTKPNVVQACWIVLVRRGEEDSIKKILSLMHHGKLSTEQTLGLLGCNPEFAYGYLAELPVLQKPEMLIRTLALRYPVETMHIKPGMFINTPAGWGKITSIRNARSDSVDLSPVDASDLIIKLILHPTDRPEPLIIQLGRGVCLFPGFPHVYKCLLCDSFITSNLYFISEKHTKREHPGQKAAYSQIAPEVPFRKILEFTTTLK